MCDEREMGWDKRAKSDKERVPLWRSRDSRLGLECRGAAGLGRDKDREGGRDRARARAGYREREREREREIERE